MKPVMLKQYQIYLACGLTRLFCDNMISFLRSFELPKTTLFTTAKSHIVSSNPKMLSQYARCNHHKLKASQNHQ